MPDLNENHRRRLLAAFQYADDLLMQTLNAVAPARPGVYRRTFQDMSPARLRMVEDYFEKIREQIRALVARFQIKVPPPSTPASWIVRTNLTSLDILFEELHPERMRGYGKMDSSAARDLERALQAIRRLLNELLAFLAEEDGA